MPTRVVDDRDAGILAGFNADVDRADDLTLEAMTRNLAAWDVSLIECDGQPAGAVYRQGPEIHVIVHPDWQVRWVTRSVLRELFSEPFLFTGPVYPDMKVHSLLYRLGFRDWGHGIMVKDARNAS